jgi:isopropylmalate/homocitrate/citramalate synthase
LRPCDQNPAGADQPLRRCGAGFPACLGLGGERAGNVDLAELVTSLQLLYGVHSGIRTELLNETARLVEAISGYQLSLNKPIVGERIFTRESGGVVHLCLRPKCRQQLLTLPAAVEPYAPEIVGLEREVVLGKKSGRFSIMHALNRLGLEAEDEEIVRMLAEVKRRSNERHSLITDEELRQILPALGPQAQVADVRKSS